MGFQKSEETKQVLKSLTNGWRTYNNGSMTSHVLMPYGVSVNIGFAHHQQHCVMNLLVGEESWVDGGYVVPKAHSYDERYTEIEVHWKDVVAKVTSSLDGDDLIILVEPIEQDAYMADKVLVELSPLWNTGNKCFRKGNALLAEISEFACAGSDERKELPKEEQFSINVGTTQTPVKHFAEFAKAPFLSVEMNSPVGIYTGRERTLDEVCAIIAAGKSEWEANKAKYGEFAELYNGMQTCIGWDTVYDPWDDAVYTPVSRNWNNGWGGSILFCWDTYFGGLMASLDNKELGYANVIAITKKHTESGFVPNWVLSSGGASRDRTQPPVGSMVCWEIYEHYHEKWLIEEVWNELYTWNTWLWNNRRTKNDLFAWGSNAYESQFNMWAETAGVHDRFGAALESGLDNSPMYDDIPFDKATNMLELEDVGLTGLYINDCRYLIKMAELLSKDSEREELKKRMNTVDEALEQLWSEEDGFYYNRRTDTGEFSKRISPTNFYALYSENVSEERAKRIIDEHYYNKEEFYGEYVMPSIARNDPAYPDQNYWRGRIWAPMNYLVYMAMEAHDLKEAQKDLADKSAALLLKEWLEMGHIHENYDGDTGVGCNVENSDKYYHWGALLSYIKLREKGFCDYADGQ